MNKKDVDKAFQQTLKHSTRKTQIYYLTDLHLEVFKVTQTTIHLSQETLIVPHLD